MSTTKGVVAVLSSTEGGFESGPLVVRGDEIVPDGRQVLLRGLTVPGLEWWNEGESVMRSVEVALTDWKSNGIWVPLSKNRWFVRALHQTGGGTRYREIVDEFVEPLSKAGAVMVPDVHWSNAVTWGQRIAQHRMPAGNSVVFWREVAIRYRKRPDVLFDLDNEPHDVLWSVRKGGGTLEGTIAGERVTQRTPGMQGLFDAVRETGGGECRLRGRPRPVERRPRRARGMCAFGTRRMGTVYPAHIYPQKPDWDGHCRPSRQASPGFGQGGGFPAGREARRPGHVGHRKCCVGW